MPEIADLEFSLHRRETGNYTVEMRFTQPGSDADIRLGQAQEISVQFDFAALTAKSTDGAAYGSLLTESLFADKDLLAAFSKARASAAALKAGLRVRLIIGPTALELNDLFWETLRDPEDPKSPLFTGTQIFFSRYLSSLDWRPVRQTSRGDLKTLVAVSNPSDLKDYDLAAVDVAGETDRARAALGEKIPVVTIPDEKDKHCTLDAVLSRLAEGCDILYLVAHGAFVKGGAWLWLEDENGKVVRVSGADLVTRVKKLENPPRLVVLASCQSAGKGAGQALQALGPRLTEAGVPAVIAMQGSVTMDTVAKFMPVFFDELQKDGLIDRALSAARDAVSGRDDFWMPVLFMRLKTGRIWYVPGFGEEGEFKKWPALLSSIEKGQCTPILGPGLYEPLIGNWRDLALGMAEKYRYPLAYFFRDALPQVTQYLAVNQDINTLLTEFETSVRVSVRERLGGEPPKELEDPKSNLADVISFAGQKLRDRLEFEQHEVLAALDLPIYLTTNFDNLMVDALREVKKDPQMVICPWNDRFTVESIFDTDRDYRPTPEKPLVYHLFGHFSVPDSLVLTEDDYFEYLIGVTSNKDLIPPVVRRAMTDTALMFLGFQLDDWSFRVFFRSMMGQQGGGRRARYTHIAVQVDPDENRNLDPKRARDYLQTYFQNAAISIYWGRSDDFLREIAQQKKSKPA
ncbi:MAG: CHAT domain-containing protein [Chloroflexota bacterium]